MCRLSLHELLPHSQQQDGSPGARLRAVDLRINDLRQTILVEFEGKDVSCLSVVALRHSLEGRLGLGRDDLKSRCHEISDLAKETAAAVAPLRANDASAQTGRRGALGLWGLTAARATTGLPRNPRSGLLHGDRSHRE